MPPGDDLVHCFLGADPAVGPGRLAYRHRPAEADAPGVTVMFCCGFASDMTGLKAQHLDRWAARRGVGYVRFDYFGHGRSDGSFQDGTIGRWRRDVARVIDGVCPPGPVLAVGSSMGGWLAALAALDRPDRIRGLVTLAAAPDFTDRILSGPVPEAARAALAAHGVWHRPSAYGDPIPITAALLAGGADHRVLDRRIPIHGPARLVHGTADPDVPFGESVKLLAAIDSPDATLTLIKDGDHRLSDARSLAHLDRAVEQVLAGLVPRTPL